MTEANVAESFSSRMQYLLPASASRFLVVGQSSRGIQTSIPNGAQVHTAELAELMPESKACQSKIDHPAPANGTKNSSVAAEALYDCIICPDQLAKCKDPTTILHRMKGLLTDQGCLIAKLPNIRHHRQVSSLLHGRWPRSEKEPDRRNPIRFFTRREVEKLFFRAGFALEALEGIPGPGDEKQPKNGSLSLDRLHIQGLNSAEMEEFYFSDYLLRATPFSSPDPGLTSIVILTHNQLPYTRQCLDSIRLYTDEPYELILVDNGSQDGTVEFLRAQKDATLICNPENRGFPAAANQGIQAAKGRQVLLLNNDTLVSTGWLRRLLRALHSNPDIGLVGPCSNCVSGEQQVEVGYDDLPNLDGFAWEWGKTHNRVMADTDRLVGFCLLMRRSVIEKIGHLDERFGLGCFEDDDFCRRAVRAGYRAVIARDAFVHHFGGRTFVGSRVDFSQLLAKNQQLFQEKWADAPLVAKPSVPPKLQGGSPATKPFAMRSIPNGGLLLERATVHSSLCMITTLGLSFHAS